MNALLKPTLPEVLEHLEAVLRPERAAPTAVRAAAWQPPVEPRSPIRVLHESLVAWWSMAGELARELEPLRKEAVALRGRVVGLEAAAQQHMKEYQNALQALEFRAAALEQELAPHREREARAVLERVKAAAHSRKVRVRTVKP